MNGLSGSRARAICRGMMVGVLLCGTAASPEMAGAQAASGTDAPPGDMAQWFQDAGITPHLALTYLYYGNPGTGLITGSSEQVGLVSVGADLDLERMAGLSGASVHVEQLFVPFTDNIGYGMEQGGVLAGDPGPFIPKVSHLTLATWRQTFMEDRLTLEVGKSHAGRHFAQPLCDVPVACVNSLLQKTAGFNPPPYANWSARVAYALSPALRVQAGVWRSDSEFPFTNGWEGGGVGERSTSWLLNLVNRKAKGPGAPERHYEAMLFYNDATQRNPALAPPGPIPPGAPPSPGSDGATGLHLGARQRVWQADEGPTALSLWGSFTRSFNQDASAGIATMGRAGLSVSGLWAARPADSFGLSLGWARLTRAKQQQLVDAATASGAATDISRSEYSFGLDATFVLDRGVIVSPYALRVQNASAYANPATGRTPRDGWAVGLLMHVQLEDWLGLAPPAP